MIRLLAFLIFLPVAAWAQDYPTPLSDKVNDYADLIPPEAEARIETMLQQARDETGVHIVMVTIERQRDYGGTGRFADFATGWFNAWGIGDATRNDGVLILVARNDHEARIILGEGFDVIWDNRAQRVIDRTMLPAFRADDYARGLEEGAASAIETLVRPFVANSTEATNDSKDNSARTDMLAIGSFLAIFGAIVWWNKRRKARKSLTQKKIPCPNCGHSPMDMTVAVLLAPGDTDPGRNRRTDQCPECGHDKVTEYVVASRAMQGYDRNRETRPGRNAATPGRASKSRSSGFGGGRSSGGGASGRW
ncbi:MAG: TPM domain-containing protein [Pseudorhodobacter sp.]